MDVRDEIGARLDKLPPEVQEQVLRYVTSLAASPALVGEKGTTLRRFASFIDTDSVREMAQAIEEDCERIDAAQW
ncbi:MAG: hypothetical protein JNN08_09435 [Bryobacterales bacterium]|nr:hypothetical protein [Bryobacterales bacterium]